LNIQYERGWSPFGLLGGSFLARHLIKRDWRPA
jgi:hypothetical protein